ncbi:MULTISPECIES: chaplin [Streptomyces]|uniref:Chaplin n=1 Tax=Streptomyces cadmiisoli TaxID=2184053 RepID=A0A2Z4J2G5_9ACTN|nr:MULTISPECIES: chaplin [Streptomyces]AWW38898.1 chaplin [Streptomyces cadmiisoli]KOV64886.1 chaplin [Streptomyces sp. AS58]
MRSRAVIATTALAASALLAGAATASAESTANGAALSSPGVASGNLVQLPIEVPANVSGNSINVAGIGNSALGNYAANR